MSKRSRLISNLLVASLFISSSSSASKMENKPFKPYVVNIDKSIGDSSNKLNVRYIGLIHGNLMFDINYPNLKNIPFNLVIKDENGEELFHKEYSGTFFHKRVQLDKFDDNVKLTFLINNINDSILSSKDVTINTKYVEDVLVKIK